MSSLITLVSSDEQSFQVDRDILRQCAGIEDLIMDLNLDDPDIDPADKSIPIRFIKGDTLERVLVWLMQHRDDPEGEEMDNSVQIVVPEWDKMFFEPLEYKDELLQLAAAAGPQQLDIKKLCSFACKTIANTFRGKTGEQIRIAWNVPKAYTPEEEEKIMRENEWCE